VIETPLPAHIVRGRGPARAGPRPGCGRTGRRILLAKASHHRDPSEWIALMSDPLLAQSAIDRLVATSYELLIEGESYRRRQRPGHTRSTAPTGVS